MFAAGVGVESAPACCWLQPAGTIFRGTIGEKVQDIGDRVRDRFSSEAKRSATGTEGL